MSTSSNGDLGTSADLRKTVPARTDARREPGTSGAARIDSEIRQVMRAVSRLFSLKTVDLPDEFFPAHLSVAIIDAVFGSGPANGEWPAPVSERYCRHFGIVRTRADRWRPPPVEDQETLGDLADHYDKLGTGGMADTVFRSDARVPGTNVRGAEYVLRLARECLRMRVGVLQDMQIRRRNEIDVTLRTLAGLDERIVRTFLTYAGDDDLVWGGVGVRRFIASAIGRRTVSTARAVSLVRRTAYELVISPRYLSHRIRLHCESSNPSTP